MPPHTPKRLLRDGLVARQFRRVVERGALRFIEQRAGPVVDKGIEFGFVHRCLDYEIPPDVHTELAHVDVRHLLANQEGGLRRQGQLLVQLGDFRHKHAEPRRHTGIHHLHRRRHLAEPLF